VVLAEASLYATKHVTYKDVSILPSSRPWKL